MTQIIMIAKYVNTIYKTFVSKQLYRDNRKIMQQSLFLEENSVTVQLEGVQ